MYQILKFKQPIPSCEIYGLEFNNGEWSYIYALNTPFELTNDNKKEMIVYEYICDLCIKEANNIHPESVNIRFKTLDEYLSILNRQIEEDLKFRQNWIRNHPDSKPATIKLENKDYSFNELKELDVHLISFIVKKEQNITIFAGI